jgi:hypothetical protein
MNTQTTTKQCEELELARRFLECLGRHPRRLSASDRPDVVAIIDGLRIGIEITVFHADETPENVGRGSNLRAEEERRARVAPGSYGTWGVLDPTPGLIARISNKLDLAAGYDVDDLEELWLLIVTGLPRLGALGSTFMIPWAINVETLNARTSEPLQVSRFDRAFIQPHFFKSIFCWNKDSDAVWSEYPPP